MNIKMNNTNYQIKDVFLKIGLYSVLLALLIVFIGPYVWSLSGSFKETNAEVLAYPFELIPKRLYLENYLVVFTRGNFGRYLINSLFVTAVTTVLALLVNSCAAYSFSKLKFRGQIVIFFLFLSTLMVPFQITMLPLFLLMKRFHWLNSYEALIIPGIANAFSIYFLAQYFNTIPRDLEDAGRIDGCSWFRIYFAIMLPLSKPAIIAISILTVLWNWNAYLWPLIVLNDRKYFTIQLGISYFSGIYQNEYSLILAASIVASLPMILIYLLLQKKFTAGIVLTGIK